MGQIGESISAPDVTEQEQEQEAEQKEKCRIIVRVKRPSDDGPWYAFGKIGDMNSDPTGHTFCAHEDEGGSKKWHGFYPLGAIIGWDAVAEEDRINGISDAFKYVAGHLSHGDAQHAYDDELIYYITREKYDSAQSFAQKWEDENTKYSLARKNCTTFVVKDSRAAGCAVPRAGWPFDNPKTFGKNIEKSPK